MELKGFTRLNESTAPELLKEEELTIFENMVLDEEIGKPKKRFGWAKYNTNAIDTGTISSLHEVVTSDGSNYLLAGINGKLRKSLDGTGAFSDVTDKGTPPYKMQPYADEFIFAEGSVAPFIVSGAALGTVTDLEIEAPDVTGVSTGDSLGGYLEAAKYYKWIIIYITDTGDKSPPSIPIINHIASTYYAGSEPYSTASVSKSVGFQDFPISPDPRVTQRQIFRTMANGDIYYFHSQIDNVQTTWWDEKADADLGSEIFGYLNAPQTAEYISLHKERIILGNLIRTVKNWVAPATSYQPLADFWANNGVTNRLFQGWGGSPNGLGIKHCYATTSGSLTAGDYTYRFVYYDILGLASDPVDSNTVTVDGTTNQSVFIPIKPFLNNDYNTISKCSIFRAKDSTNDSDFKYITFYDPLFDYDNPSTIVYDFTDDGTYAEGDTYIRPSADTEKCGIAFSEIGQPATFVLEDIRNIYPDDGDQIVGLFDDRDGILIFKEKSICKIFTGAGDPTNWNLVKLLPNIGCDEPNSLVKYGNDYVFSFQSSIYIWNSSSGLKEIGVEIWDSLALVTAYHCATADSGWYIFGVSGAGLTTGFGFLIYDYNVGTWYKFTTTSIPYVAKIKENGDDIGTFLTSNASYLLYYSENEIDSDTGSTVQITPKLRTKTFGESIALLRLRKIKFNYLKLTGQNVVITIVNPESGITNTYTDSTGSGWKLYESAVKDTDLLKETSKFYVNITGAGLVEFGTFRLEARPILRGKRELTNG